MLGRALLRAKAPVAFSGGFNPRPRLSIPLPRSVGTQSAAERFCAILSTEQTINCHEVQGRLVEQLPIDCVLLAVQCVEGKRVYHPRTVRYVFTFVENLTPGRREYLSTCKKDLEAGRPIIVRRYQAKKKVHRPFDISGFAEELKFSENRVEISCRVSQQGSARVDELMQWLHIETEQLKEPVMRTAIQWEHTYQEHN